MLQLSGHVTSLTSYGWKTHSRKQETVCLLLILLDMERVCTLVGINIPTTCSLKKSTLTPYSPFHLSTLSVETAWNAVANIVLVTQPLTKIVGWLWLALVFLCTMKDCPVLLLLLLLLFFLLLEETVWRIGESVAMSFIYISSAENFRQGWETLAGRSAREGNQFAINWGMSVKVYWSSL